MGQGENTANAEHQAEPLAAGEPDKAVVSRSDETQALAREEETTPSALARIDRVRRRHHSHRHRHSGPKQHWSRRSKLLLGVMGLILLANLLVVSFLGVQLYMSDQKNNELRLQLAKSQDELNRLKPELEKSLADIQALLKGRLPGLVQIEYDRVITLNEGYIKNIIFNKVSSRNLRGYEFRVVMQNDTLTTIWPKFKINFFDEQGFHISTVQASDEKESLLQVNPLGPGEERAGSSAIIKLREDEKMPYFFLIRLN